MVQANKMPNVSLFFSLFFWLVILPALLVVSYTPKLLLNCIYKCRDLRAKRRQKEYINKQNSFHNNFSSIKYDFLFIYI